MKINKPKSVKDVFGYQDGCVNFQKCPLCYGCRRHSSVDSKCVICLQDKKKNICNVELHKAHLITQMITKENIIFNNKITF